MRCTRCKRPLKVASPSGLGPVCYAKAGKEIPTVERDLLGFDVPAAAAAACERVRVHIEIAAVDALMAVKHQAVAARRRLGVWA
jgi:hypothetical protein